MTEADFVLVQPTATGDEDHYQHSINLANGQKKITVHYAWPVSSILKNRLLPWYTFCEWAPGMEEQNDVSWDKWEHTIVQEKVMASLVTFHPGITECWRMVHPTAHLIAITLPDNPLDAS
jgi:hypothetical protein